MNSPDDILWNPIDAFKDHKVLVFDLISMQTATDFCHYPELNAEPLSLELNFIFPLKSVTALNILGERVGSDVVDTFGVVGKISEIDSVSLQQIFNRIPLLKCRYYGSFLSELDPIVENDTFALINTQSSSMQGEHWIMTATTCHKLCCADSPGRPSFFKLQYKQMMPEPLQSRPNVCGFCTINEAVKICFCPWDGGSKLHFRPRIVWGTILIGSLVFKIVAPGSSGGNYGTSPNLRVQEKLVKFWQGSQNTWFRSAKFFWEFFSNSTFNLFRDLRDVVLS